MQKSKYAEYIMYVLHMENVKIKYWKNSLQKQGK